MNTPARINYRSQAMRVVYRDRRHWTLCVGRAWIERWCPGASCSLPHVRYLRHWIRVGVNQ